MNIAPGLNGLLAQRQMASQSQAGELSQISGLLGVQNAMFEQQLNPLKMQQLQQSIQDQKRKSDIVNGILGGGGGGSGGPAGGASFGGVSGQTGLLDVLKDPAKIAALKMAGIDLVDMFKHQTTPQEFKGGSSYQDRTTGEWRSVPKTETGMLTGRDGSISMAPGATDAIGASTAATEGAKAGFDIVKIPDGKGGEISLPRSIAVQLLTQSAPKQPQMQPQPAPAPSMAPDPLAGRSAAEIAAIQQVQRASANGQPMSVNVPASGPIPTSRIVGGFGQAPNPIDVKVDEKRALNNLEKTGDVPQAQLRIETQVGDIGRLRSLAQEIMKSPALDRAVGLGSYIPSIRGGDSAGTEALVSSLKAQVSGMKLQAMRDASKTGGAVGNVTEKEWPRLESMIVALDEFKMNPALFRQKLSELVVALNDAEKNITTAFTAEYGSVGGKPPAANNDPLGIRKK